MKNRRWQYGAMATMITILGIVLILAANAVADRLSERMGWQIDLTADGRYELSEEAKEALLALPEDVTITVMNEEDDLANGSTYAAQTYQILQQIRRLSDHIRLQFVNLSENPTWASKYPDLNLAPWTVLVESGERQEAVRFAQMYEVGEDGSTIAVSRAEQKLIGVVLSVTSEEKPLITVLTGYSEGEPGELTALLEGNQFEVETQSVLTEEIDPRAGAAILYAPSKDPEAASLQKLDAWLENGGEQGKSLFVFLDPNTPELPRLAEFLEEWGIALGEGLAFEGDANLYYERPYYPIAQYGDMEYAEGMTAGDLVIMALCRPVTTLYESKDNTETRVLLQFTGSSGAVALGAEEIRREDISGDIRAMVLGSHSWYGSEGTRSHVGGSGSALAFSGNLVTSDTFANGRYILNLFRKLVSADAGGADIPARDLTQISHTMSAGQANTAVWVFLVILPAAVLLCGIVVWLRRRHR